VKGETLAVKRVLPPLLTCNSPATQVVREKIPNERGTAHMKTAGPEGGLSSTTGGKTNPNENERDVFLRRAPIPTPQNRGAGTRNTVGVVSVLPNPFLLHGLRSRWAGRARGEKGPKGFRGRGGGLRVTLTGRKEKDGPGGKSTRYSQGILKGKKGRPNAVMPRGGPQQFETTRAPPWGGERGRMASFVGRGGGGGKQTDVQRGGQVKEVGLTRRVGKTKDFGRGKIASRWQKWGTSRGVGGRI